MAAHGGLFFRYHFRHYSIVNVSPADESITLYEGLRALLRGMPNADLLRFVTRNRHPPYGHRSGIIQAAYKLWREGTLPPEKRTDIRAILDWFNEHLDAPERLSTSRYPRAQATAVSWIRSSALEHVKNLRRLVALIEAEGISVDELRTTQPGYVVHEDAHQVVALPFSDTPR
jgi:hypothetical protein